MDKGDITFYFTTRGLKKANGDFETEYVSSSIEGLEKMALDNNIILDKIWVGQACSKTKNLVDQYYLKKLNNEWVREEVI